MAKKRKKKLSRFLTELGFEKPEALPSVQPLDVWKTPISFERRKAETFDLRRHLPKQFSFSQLQTYETCPWQYRYRHVLRIQTRGQAQLSFGQSLHGALERFFLRLIELRSFSQTDLFGQDASAVRPSVPSLQELLACYEQAWVDEWFESDAQKKTLYKKGREIMKAFYERHQDDWPEVVAVEQSFTLSLDGYKVKGSIDRVDKGENGLRIVDYKSGKAPKTVKPDQLIIYQIALEETGQKVEHSSYYYLPDQQEKIVAATAAKKEAVKKKALQTLNSIHDGDFSPKPSVQTCKKCAYKDICSFSAA